MNWAESVKCRDKNRCIVCGSTENINAHHLCSRSKYPEISNDINNGITLCRKCHRAVHYGSYFCNGAVLQPLEISPLYVWQKIKAFAEDNGESLNGFVNRAIDEAMNK